MEKLQMFLLVLQIIVAVLLIILILLQKSSADSLSGIGGHGGLKSFVSSKASSNILSKATMILVAIFMLNCLVLASISKHISDSLKSELDKVIEKQEKNNDSKPVPPSHPVIPAVE